MNRTIHELLDQVLAEMTPQGTAADLLGLMAKYGIATRWQHEAIKSSDGGGENRRPALSREVGTGSQEPVAEAGVTSGPPEADIVSRLRAPWHDRLGILIEPRKIELDAADEIERLQRHKRLQMEDIMTLGQEVGRITFNDAQPASARSVMREIGEVVDPVREMLRRMLAEHGDDHYHTCPADNDSGPCECFAGHLHADAKAVLEAALASQPPAAPVDMGTAMEVYDHAYILVLQKSGDARKAEIAGVHAAINAAYDIMSSDGEPSNGKQPLMASRPAPPVPSDPQCSAGRETELLAALVFEAMRFSIWAAGQGLMAQEGEPTRDPEDFLYEYSKALDIDDWDGLAEVARDHIRAVPQPAPVWQPIETAPKDGTPIDLWIHESRIADAYWGKPEHSCGEAGSYCDCCPSYDGWCDVFGYLTGPDGSCNSEPTHWMPRPTSPLSRPEHS